MSIVRRAIKQSLLLTAIGICPALFGQGNPVPRDFGNWLSAYGSILRGFEANPGVPMALEFTLQAGNDLVYVVVDTDTQGYLASIIPTPGLTPSSTCGTSGVRCAADASNDIPNPRYSAGPRPPSAGPITGTAARPGASPQARPPYRANAVTTSHPPLPTFQLLPFPPVFPSQITKPPIPTCDSVHDSPLLVVNHLTASVTAYGSCSGTLIKKIPVTSNPLQVEITPDGSQAIVTSFDSAITFIDLSTYTPTTIQTSSIYNPSGISISPDGTRAYVTSFSPIGFLLTIDIQKRQIIQTLSLTEYPQSVFLTPDGSLAWITCPFDGQIVVVDTLTNTIVKTLSVDGPTALAFNSTGTLAFIALGFAAQVEVLDATTYQFIRNIDVGSVPGEIGIGPDDSFAVVTNFDGPSVTIINLIIYATVTVALPGTPLGLSMRY
jgi:hypothetical protein